MNSLFFLTIEWQYPVLHAMLVLVQATTLNVAFNSHNKALLTIMMSNNVSIYLFLHLVCINTVICRGLTVQECDRRFNEKQLAVGRGNWYAFRRSLRVVLLFHVNLTMRRVLVHMILVWYKLDQKFYLKTYHVPFSCIHICWNSKLCLKNLCVYQYFGLTSHNKGLSNCDDLGLCV